MSECQIVQLLVVVVVEQISMFRVHAMNLLSIDNMVTATYYNYIVCSTYTI